MKEGTTFYRCILCSHIVNKWNIKEGGCPNCAGQRIVATNLSLWEKMVQICLHPCFWRWPNA